MEDEAGVPSPEDSGSDGSQSRAEPTSRNALSPTPPMPMADRLAGLAAANLRAFGGKVPAGLVEGITLQLALDLQQTRHELALSRSKAERLAEDLASERSGRAVLSERLSAFQATRNLKNLCIAVGSLFLSQAYKAWQSNHMLSAIVPAIFGALLLFFSWFSVPRGDKK